jgi:hypothetical protein
MRSERAIPHSSHARQQKTFSLSMCLTAIP